MGIVFMITIIRNDHQCRFAHEIHGIKIKEEKPNYKILATLENEGLCIYESPNYCEIASTFDMIVEAIMNGDRYVFVRPPIADKMMTKEEFDSSDIHDFCKYKEDDPDRPLNLDIYGREIPQDNRDFNTFDEDEYYEWQNYEDKKRNTWNNKNLDNRYPPNDFNNL